MQAHQQCRQDYPEVERSSIAELCCLGVEVFGRWGQDSLRVVHAAVATRVHELPSRVRRGTQARLLRRWWGLLSCATQRAVARNIIRGTDADLPVDLTEAIPGISELPA